MRHLFALCINRPPNVGNIAALDSKQIFLLLQVQRPNEKFMNDNKKLIKYE